MKFNFDRVVKDIKSIKIQGATNIAKASIGALFELSGEYSDKNIDIFLKEIGQKAEVLAWARPDEPLNQNLLNFLLAKIKEDKSGNIKDKTSVFKRFCQEVLCLITKNEELITANGIKLIRVIYENKKKPVLVFTHCNSSSVFRILKGAHAAGLPIKVYDSETRPRFQGRIMAKHLAEAGIDVTMMTDSAAPFVISKNDPDGVDIDLIIIGADVVGTDGSVLNKIGSYSLALAAKNAGVSFYAASSLLKMRKDIESYKEIEIEKRDPTELWQKSLKGIKAINYAFDTVPPEFISGLVTEFGVLKPEDVERIAMEKYKGIF